MDKNARQSWRFGKRDALFLSIVAAVILLLVLGTSERTTKPTPEDEVHRHTTSRAGCLSCHDRNGVRPQPKGHTQMDQCFQCHAQPKGWKATQ